MTAQVQQAVSGLMQELGVGLKKLQGLHEMLGRESRPPGSSGEEVGCSVRMCALIGEPMTANLSLSALLRLDLDLVKLYCGGERARVISQRQRQGVLV